MRAPRGYGKGLTLLARGIVSGSLFRDLTGEHGGALVDAVDGPSGWPFHPTAVTDWNAYLSRAGVPARWSQPDLDIPSDALAAFAARAREVSLDHIRVTVDDAASWRRINGTAITLPGATSEVSVSAYVTARERGPWSWRWPLRVGVLAGRGAPALRRALLGHGWHRALYEVFDATPEDECELLFLPRGGSVPDLVRASIAVLNGLDTTARFAPAMIPPVTGTAGRIVSPQAHPRWFEQFVAHLSHDLPMDVALQRARPGAMLEASDDFVARATIRQWAHAVLERLRDAGATVDAEWLESELVAPFDSELVAQRLVEPARRLAEVRGVPLTVRAHPPAMAAPPRRAEAEAAAGYALAAAAPEPATSPEASDELPDRRRVQAIVRLRREGGPPTVTQEFVPGELHDIRVCVAAAERDGAVTAPERLEHPEPGSSVKLDVSVIVGGERTVRHITLPPVADTAWTKAVEFRVPAQADGFAVYVEVAYRKRVLQSLVLCGCPFALSVDGATPVRNLSERQAASAQLTLVDTPSGPALIDLDNRIGDLRDEQLEAVIKQLRLVLLNTVVASPESLAGVAGPLTVLAVHGRTLYDRLAGMARNYHDDDPWIHVNAFTTADVPLELTYCHPLPENDESVPICDEALAGATSCGSDCPSRQRSDRVCPFGFWATSKVIERRCHVPGRTAATPAAARRVRPLASSVVGVSERADEADNTASKRIVTALTDAVARTVVARSWADLEHIAADHPSLVVLVTHTVSPPEGDLLGTALELNGDLRKLHRITEAVVNPGLQEPGPVVLALGCDTDTITAGFTDLVLTLHSARAEIVLSARSPVSGRGVADFLERFLANLHGQLHSGRDRRFGAAMLATRQATISEGDLMALALTASGDADVELEA